MFISDIYAHLGSVASSALDGQTTIPPAPSGWSWEPDTGESEASSSAVSSVTAASECPAGSSSGASTLITEAASATAAATGGQTSANGAASWQGMTMWAFAVFFGAVVIAL